MTTFYEELGVPPNASSEDIRRAYRRLAKKYHPDVNPRRRAWAEARMTRLNEAYNTLIDPAKRWKYDEILGYRGEYQLTEFDSIQEQKWREEFQQAIKIQAFTNRVDRPLLILGLAVWALGMGAIKNFFSFYGTESFRESLADSCWTLGTLAAGCGLRKYLVNKFRQGLFAWRYDRVWRYLPAFSLTTIFCLLSLKAFLVIEPNRAEYSHRFDQTQEKGHGGLSWVVSVTTILPTLIFVPAEGYSNHNRFFWLPGDHAFLDDRLKSVLRSVYERNGNKIYVDVLVRPPLNPLIKELHAEVRNPKRTSDEVFQALRDLTQLLKEEAAKPGVRVWEAPDNFEDHVTLWIGDLKSFKPIGSKNTDWELGNRPQLFMRRFEFSVPLDQAKLQAIPTPRKLTVHFGATNTQDPLSFEFPLPFDFSEIVATNRFRQQNPSAGDSQRSDPSKYRIDAERLLPPIMRETFPELDFSTFPVIRRTPDSMPTNSLLAMLVYTTDVFLGRLMAILIIAIDVVLVVCFLGLMIQLILSFIRRSRPGTGLESQG